MRLEKGTRLGPYEIETSVGAGGMGEVYRAKDKRLDRTVAIKVLPPLLAMSSRARERFQREARSLSKVNHPSICTLHDVGEDGDHHYLVMEYVEGEPLDEVLRRGPLPSARVIEIGMQIADALDWAHRQNLVHRDLKPSNIMLTKNGVKLLDFGLARSTLEVANAPEVSAVPTMSRPITEEGTVMGTYPYMSPEQLEGRGVDRRSDIWAFGVTLYEMATGHRAFEATSQASLIAAILKEQPRPIENFVSVSPLALERVVRGCLKKDPDERFQSAHDIKLMLESVGDSMSTGESRAVAVPAGPSRSHLKFWNPQLALGALGALVLGAVAFWIGSQSDKPRSMEQGSSLHAVIPLGEDLSLAGWASPIIAIAKDASAVAYVARHGNGMQQLYVKKLDGSDAVLVPRSGTAEGPFFSPNGDWVAFAVGVSGLGDEDGELRKYSISTGVTQKVCDIEDYFGGYWTDENQILFVDFQPSGLWRVSADGGSPKVLLGEMRRNGEVSRLQVGWPRPLPGGRRILATEWTHQTLIVLDLETAEWEDLGLRAWDYRYIDTGHLIYPSDDGALMAVPFDAATLRFEGSPHPILSQIAQGGIGTLVFAIANDGTAIYATGSIRGSGFEEMRVVELDPSGEGDPLPHLGISEYRTIDLSPDGKKLAIASRLRNLWIYEFDQRAATRINLDRFFGIRSLLWAPDGKHLYFAAYETDRTGMNLYSVSLQPGHSITRHTHSTGEAHPRTWDPKTGGLIYAYSGDIDEEESAGLYRFVPGSDSEHEIILDNSISPYWAKLSPSGDLLAYASFGADRRIYLTTYPENASTIVVTPEGGDTPQWSRDGSTLYYEEGNELYSVRVRRTPELSIEPPTRVYGNFDLVSITPAADPGKFYGVEPVPGTGRQTELKLVTNWPRELRRRLASSD